MPWILNSGSVVEGGEDADFLEREDSVLLWVALHVRRNDSRIHGQGASRGVPLEPPVTGPESLD